MQNRSQIEKQRRRWMCAAATDQKQICFLPAYDHSKPGGKKSFRPLPVVRDRNANRCVRASPRQNRHRPTGDSIRVTTEHDSRCPIELVKACEPNRAHKGPRNVGGLTTPRGIAGRRLPNRHIPAGHRDGDHNDDRPQRKDAGDVRFGGDKRSQTLRRDADANHDDEQLEATSRQSHRRSERFGRYDETKCRLAYEW